ncbi:ester cyclase [Geodermatophilus sp. URMC 63]
MTQITHAPGTRERAHEVMTRIAAAWEQGDLAAVDEVFTEDLVYHAPPFADMGRAELGDFITAFRAAFPDAHVQVHGDVVDGTTSVHRWTAEGTFTGTTPLLPGVEPTGRHASSDGAYVLHWSGDRVSEAWHLGDWLGWLVQTGVLPPPPGMGG